MCTLPKSVTSGFGRTSGFLQSKNPGPSEKDQKEKRKMEINRVKEDWLIWRGTWMVGGLVLAILVSVWWIEGRVPPEIPLLYSRPWGEGQLVGSKMLWWLAGGLGVAGVFGLILGTKMLAGQKTVARIIVWTAVLTLALGFLAVWNVWWRVGI